MKESGCWVPFKYAQLSKAGYSDRSMLIDLFGLDVGAHLGLVVVDEGAGVQLVPPDVEIELPGVDGPVEDEDHDLNDVDVPLGPSREVGDELGRVFIDGRVERADHASSVGEHSRVPVTQLVQLDLAALLPAGPVLLAVDVEGEPEGPRSLELPEKLRGQSEPVGVDDRLHTAFLDESHDLDDLRMDQRIPSGYGDDVELPELLEDVQVFLDLVERLVAFALVLPIAAVAGEIALGGRLEPGNRIVGEIPGKPVVVQVVQLRHRHYLLGGRCFHAGTALRVFARGTVSIRKRRSDSRRRCRDHPRKRLTPYVLPATPLRRSGVPCPRKAIPRSRCSRRSSRLERGPGASE